MHEPFSEQELILFASTGIILVLIILVVAAVLIQHKRKFRHRQRLAEVKNQYEKTILETELKIKNDTLKAVSRNLHDNIGSNISTAMLLLYTDEQMAAAERETNRREALHMLDGIVDDLKHLARSLSPAYLSDIGLTEAIRQRIQQLEKTKKYQLNCHLQEAPSPLDPEKQLILYYIFQEAINNINTHAMANSIEVTLRYEKDELLLLVKDNGIGITTADAAHPARGSGLTSMSRQAAMIQASLQIDSHQQEGTSIRLRLPHPYIPDTGIHALQTN